VKLSRLSQSLTFRLALLYMVLVAASTALLLGAAFWVGVQAPLQQVQASVAAEADALTRRYSTMSRQTFVKVLRQRAASPAPRAGYHALLGADGSVIDSNLPNWPAARAQRDWLRFEFGTYESGDEVEHETLARDITFADGVRLLLGRETEDIDEREDFISEATLWGGAFTLALGLIGGLLTSLVVGRRIEAVNATARRVIRGDLSERIPLHGGGDDFDQLAETLNHMLARIEDLVFSVSRVSDSIAHELRTPLTRLHGDLEVLAAANRDDPERGRLAAGALAEAERLQSTFDALLRIARIETGRHAPAFRSLDMAILLDDAVDLYQAGAEARGQTLSCAIERPLPMQGDPDLVFQAISNLLDNAIKYAPDGGHIGLVARRVGASIALDICDDGPGVAAEHQPHLTERFFRAPNALSRPGVGLGLSFVAAVARMHGATLAFEGRAPGFQVSLTWVGES
jgi:signal transduction histidine kinase